MRLKGILLIATIAMIASAACTRPEAEGDAHAGKHSHGHSADEDETEKGPHGGRLLREESFALEVTIFERGVPPEFRVYAYHDGKPIDPKDVSVTIELHRLGGRTEAVGFRSGGDFLIGNRTVEEPHSFDVDVSGRWQGRSYAWKYASYEGRVTLAPEEAKRSGIVVETAGPASLRSALRLYGRVVPNEDRLTHVMARFAGIVKETRKALGDRVREGETLAVVESNESLRRYEVKSELAGTVIAKHATVGGLAGGEEPLFVVADLSTVWVDLNVYRHDFARLKTGQTVVLAAGEDLPPATATIDYVSPVSAENTQTTLTRVVLPNPTGDWRPGIFVTGDVIVDDSAVPLAVRATALQTLRDWDVVFVNEGDIYEARPLELGRRDGEWVEVLAGLGPGEKYVSEQSFVLKADVGKAGASHDH